MSHLHILFHWKIRHNTETRYSANAISSGQCCVVVVSFEKLAVCFCCFYSYA